MATTAYRVVFPAPGEADLERFESLRVGPGQVRVRTLHSLVSSGTETIQYTGRFDPESHWGRYVEYPVRPGYSVVGEITEIGDEVFGLRVGELVALRGPHASEQVVDAVRCSPLPDGIAPEDAIWFGLAKIARMGALAAQYTAGDRVAVIGAGPIGQMSARWAFASGCAVVAVVDPLAYRLDLAGAGGATIVVDRDVVSDPDGVQESLAGLEPGVVIDTTGNAAVFPRVLGLVAARGRVVLLGDTGFPAQQHLTSDVITRGLTIVGAHDSLSGGWDQDRPHHDVFFSLVASGRFDLEGLTTHAVTASECSEAYELLASRAGGVLGVRIDW